jgi:hypothetical protein
MRAKISRRTSTGNTIITVMALLLMSSSQVLAEQAPKISEEQKAQLEAAGFETDPAVFKQLATGGQPMGRWTEGLTFEGIEPMPWLKSAANWTPGSELVQSNEVRVTFMGSSPILRPGQMGV